MPLMLIPPGRRKGNPFWLVRGTLGERRIEVSTHTRDKAAAEAFKDDLVSAWRQCRVPAAGEAVTFRQATRHYEVWRCPSDGDHERIARIVAILGEKLVGDIGQADLVDAAERIYPHAVNATRNRWVIKPAAAILHYAARNNWCPWIRIESFDEPPPRTRNSNTATRDTLLAALEVEIAEAEAAHAHALAIAGRTRRTAKQLHATRRKYLFILWLFHHWNRVSDPLRITWDHLDLPARTYLIYIGKTREWRTKPLADEVFECLANEPEHSHAGPLFPWSHKSSVYNWLRPLCRRLGVTFTPHMARHYGGWALNRAGAGLKTIMAALDHADPQSSVRYQSADIGVVREAMTRVRDLERPDAAKHVPPAKKWGNDRRE